MSPSAAARRPLGAHGRGFGPLARAAIPLLVLAAAAVAGCYEDEGATVWTIQGTFTTAATQDQMLELQQKAAARGGDLRLLESYPEQFVASGFDAGGCDAFRAEADAMPYVADVGSCTSATFYDG